MPAGEGQGARTSSSRWSRRSAGTQRQRGAGRGSRTGRDGTARGRSIRRARSWGLAAPSAQLSGGLAGGGGHECSAVVRLIDWRIDRRSATRPARPCRTPDPSSSFARPPRRLRSQASHAARTRAAGQPAGRAAPVPGRPQRQAPQFGPSNADAAPPAAHSRQLAGHGGGEVAPGRAAGVCAGASHGRRSRGPPTHPPTPPCPPRACRSGRLRCPAEDRTSSRSLRRWTRCSCPNPCQVRQRRAAVAVLEPDGVPPCMHAGRPGLAPPPHRGGGRACCQQQLEAARSSAVPSGAWAGVWGPGVVLADQSAGPLPPPRGARPTCPSPPPPPTHRRS